MKITVSALSLILFPASISAFTVPRNTIQYGGSVMRSPSGPKFGGRSVTTVPRMSNNVEEEVAALRAAAAKAREDAQRLSKAMGKDIGLSASSQSASTAPTAIKRKSMSPADMQSLCKSIDFRQGDASSQCSTLDELVQDGSFSSWKSAQTGGANTGFERPLRPYPVSLGFLENRSNGQITGKSLGVGGEMEVSLDDFKDATIAITLGSSVIGIGSLALFPGNVGATVCYLIALVPILWIAIGSSAPGILAGLIASVRGTADDTDQKEDRICRHEAAHLLCGYLCGLPVKQLTSQDDGVPCVEFHANSEGDAATAGREFTPEEIATLSVVAMSGSVGEALEYDMAKGGENDFLELNVFFRRSKDFLGAAKQQDLTRWGALAAYQLIKGNKDKYENLVVAFKERKNINDCVAIIES